MELLKTSLQKTLHAEIPLTKAIEITVKEVTSISVTLVAPLANNINHKRTAFGGSLYSVAVLAGWGLIYSQLYRRDLQAHIVIQESNINYQHPVTELIEAKCSIHSEDALAKPFAIYKKRSKARIILDVEIMADTEIAVLFRGKYVIHA